MVYILLDQMLIQMLIQISDHKFLMSHFFTSILFLDYDRGICFIFVAEENFGSFSNLNRI